MLCPVRCACSGSPTVSRSSPDVGKRYISSPALPPTSQAFQDREHLCVPGGMEVVGYRSMSNKDLGAHDLLHQPCVASQPDAEEGFGGRHYALALSLVWCVIALPLDVLTKRTGESMTEGRHTEHREA